MLATISTDGSYNDFKKTAGFAFWISSNAGALKRFGGLKHCCCPTEAEIKAIANALYYMDTRLEGVTKIIVNTDSTSAIRMISTTGVPRNKRFKNALKRVRQILKKYPHELKHVKAHSDVKDARSFVNEWCDKQAKIGRKSLEF